MSRLFVPIIHGVSLARPDEADTLISANMIAQALERLGFESDILALDLNLSALETLTARKPHAAFNLVESLKGDAALSYLAPAALDHLGVAYTGARTTPYFITLSKLLTKQHLRSHGLPTADWWEAGDAIPADAKLIVKSVMEHASVGIDANSIVTGAQADNEMRARSAKFGGQFFAERYIAGREFTLGLLEREGVPLVLPIPELDFARLPAARAQIIDYAAKWDKSDPAYCLLEDPLFGVETREPQLAQRMIELAREAWRAFNLNGYARIDFRVGADGLPLILEINVNPCLALDGGFVRMAALAGFDYDALIAALIDAARAPARKAA